MSEQNNCVSCGKPTDSQERYSYCAQCDAERKDRTVKPKVYEYVGGKLGALRNRRGAIEYSLKQLNFRYHSERYGLSVYERPDDGSPTGLIAIVTKDSCIVILNGEYELESLMQHPCGFADNPIVEQLPDMIEALHPEQWEIVQRIKRTDAG